MMISTHSGPHSFGPFVKGEHELLADTLASSMLEFKTNTLFLIGCDTSEDFGLKVKKSLLDKHKIDADVRIMDKRLMDISTPDFSTPSFNPRHFNPGLFNHEHSNPGLFNHELFNPILLNPGLFNSRL